MERRLDARVAKWVAEDALARKSGHVYAIDVGQLALYAARSGDASLYRPLRRRLADRFVVRKGKGAFLAWRRGEEPPDASGTTEALRAAQALWIGARAFGREADRALARDLLAGYAAHGWTSRGVWMIRNYFNFGTRAYATNSYLVDYAPDFLRRVAEATGGATLARLAKRSAKLVRRARTEAGLLHQVIQPEVLTLRPGAAAIFSPNGRVQLANTAAVAEHSVAACPAVAKGVARFAAARLGDLRSFYDAETGAPASREQPGVGGYASLLRLVVRLRAAGHEAAAAAEVERRLHRAVVARGRAFARRPRAPRAYVAGQLLLALEAARRGAPATRSVPE